MNGFGRALWYLSLNPKALVILAAPLVRAAVWLADWWFVRRVVSDIRRERGE